MGRIGISVVSLTVMAISLSAFPADGSAFVARPPIVVGPPIGPGHPTCCRPIPRQPPINPRPVGPTPDPINPGGPIMGVGPVGTPSSGI